MRSLSREAAAWVLAGALGVTLSLILASVLSCEPPAPEVWEGIDRARASCDQVLRRDVRTWCVVDRRVHVCVRDLGSSTWRCAPAASVQPSAEAP